LHLRSVYPTRGVDFTTFWQILWCGRRG
jgi:hypothetical protein